MGTISRLFVDINISKECSMFNVAMPKKEMGKSCLMLENFIKKIEN